MPMTQGRTLVFAAVTVTCAMPQDAVPTPPPQTDAVGAMLSAQVPTDANCGVKQHRPVQLLMLNHLAVDNVSVFVPFRAVVIVIIVVIIV